MAFSWTNTISQDGVVSAAAVQEIRDKTDYIVDHTACSSDYGSYLSGHDGGDLGHCPSHCSGLNGGYYGGDDQQYQSGYNSSDDSEYCPGFNYNDDYDAVSGKQTYVFSANKSYVYTGKNVSYDSGQNWNYDALFV